MALAATSGRRSGRYWASMGVGTAITNVSEASTLGDALSQVELGLLEHEEVLAALGDAAGHRMDGVRVMLVASDEAGAERAAEASPVLESAGAQVDMHLASMDESSASATFEAIVKWVR